MLFRVVLIVLLLIVLFATYVRLAPVNPDDWHVDPGTEDAGQGSLLSQADSPVWSEPPQEVLNALNTIALSTDRTVRLAGDVASGRITYVTRSLVMGFPDMTTVGAAETPEGTKLTILARQRFGIEDLGTNQGRIDDWLEALTEALPPQ